MDLGEVKDSGSPVKETCGTKRKISLESCGACGVEEAKYRCPACLKHSCSLPCVKKHKSELGCTGVRDKTAYVPLSKFDEMNLLSDYRFLEDSGRLADSVSRDFSHLPNQKSHKVRLMKHAASRLNLELMLLPNGFTRRRENSTYFHKGLQQFFWHVKLLFPQSSSEYTERRVPDGRTLKEILTPYIHPTESDPVKRQKLKVYVHATFENLRVFMKVENRKSNSIRYHELSLLETLQDNLRKKTVIEYPVLHIVLKDHGQNYVLLEQEAASQHHREVEEKEAVAETRAEEAGRTVPAKDGADDEIEEGEIRDDDDYDCNDHKGDQTDNSTDDRLTPLDFYPTSTSLIFQPHAGKENSFFGVFHINARAEEVVQMCPCGTWFPLLDTKYVESLG
ncbi:box C/D snoRNA protein 1 [Arapaima gigas]